MEGVLTLVDGPISWLDCALFRAIHPITMPGPTMLSIAECFAVGPLLVALLAIALIWIVTRCRTLAVEASITVASALAVNWLIGMCWYRPRPFLLPGVHAWIQNAATNSFPSDHLTMQCGIAAVLIVTTPATDPFT